jgi:hypothetical protein
MPEINQYSFSHKELVELMIKKLDLHEGKWMLLVTFGFGAVNGGPTPDQVMPTGVVGVQTVGIQKAGPDSPATLTVDAEVVNPASNEKKQPSSRSRGASPESS